MTEVAIHVLSWIFIAGVWAFVLIGGYRTVQQLREVFAERASDSRKVHATTILKAQFVR